MKPWLLEILACPIDKHFPLTLDVFSIEDPEGFARNAGNQEGMNEDLAGFFGDAGEEEENSGGTVIHVSTVDGTVLVFDTLVRKPVPVVAYLDGITASIKELHPVRSHVHPRFDEILHSLLTFNDAVVTARERVSKPGCTPEEQASVVSSMEPDLLLLNWFKQAVEIEEGIMTCSACNRWFPIRDTIPQMLPDALRKEKFDVDFLTKWQHLVQPAVLKEGLPFRL